MRYSAAVALASIVALLGCLDDPESIFEPLDDLSEITEIAAIEYQALVALYESTNGTGWTNNTGWIDTNTPCSWYGVHCESGTVFGLNFDGNRLAGSLPQELGDLRNLTNLEILNLHNNRLSGSIPVVYGYICRLGFTPY